MSAAVFAGRGSRELELVLPSSPDTHVISVELASFDLNLEVDGRVTHAGTVRRNQCELIRAGERVIARVTADWRVVQFYLPVDVIGQAVEALGMPICQARGLELIPPRFTRDPLIARLGRMVDARLRRGGEFFRLEFDDMALTLAERPVRRHSSITPPHRAADTSAKTLVFETVFIWIGRNHREPPSRSQKKS